MKDYTIGKSSRGNPVYPGSPSNEHRTLIGTTGSGKSTAAMKFIVDAVGNGDRVIVFNTRNSLDPKLLGERAPLYELQRKVIKPAFEGIKLPLFSPCRSSDDVVEPTALLVSRISKMLAQTAGLSDAQQHKLQEAVSAALELGAYHEYGIAALEDLLTGGGCSAEKVIQRLSLFFDNNLLQDGDFIASECMPIIEINVNDFDLDDQRIIVEFMLAWLFYYGQKGGFKEQSMVIFIDEVQNYSFKPDSPLYRLINESRKFNIKLLLAMTSLSGKKGIGICTMAGTNYFFRPALNDLEGVAKLIDNKRKSQCMRELSLLKVGECIATGSFIINNILVNLPTKLISIGDSSSESAVSSTNPNTKRLC